MWMGSHQTYKSVRHTSAVALILCQIAVLLGRNISQAIKISSFTQIHSGRQVIKGTVGDTVTLPCKIHNLGDRQVVWKHGSNVIGGTNTKTFDEDRIQVLKDLTLKITRVELIDEGNYVCQVIGSIPSLSLTHTVYVLERPTINLMPESGNVIVEEGDSIEIQCIPHGKPTPHIQWSLKDNSYTTLDGKLRNESKLLLAHVTKRHDGIYVCSAENGVGPPAIGTIHVHVLYAPEIHSPKRRVHGGVGSKAQLVCIVDSHPEAEVNWKIGQQIVPLSARVYHQVQGSRREEHTLTFEYVCESDFAVYTCEAFNSLGTDAKHIEFSGISNPPVLRRWDVSVENNELIVELSWDVESYNQLIDYHLFFRRAQIYNVSSTILQLGVDTSQLGWTELTIPADWSTSFYQTKSFTIRGLSAGALYEVAIKARNQYGWSSLSSRSFFSTFPETRQEVKKYETKGWLLQEDSLEDSLDFSFEAEEHFPDHNADSKGAQHLTINIFNIIACGFFLLISKLR